MFECLVCSKTYSKHGAARKCCHTPRTNQRSSSRQQTKRVLFGSSQDCYNMNVQSQIKRKVEHTQRTLEEERELDRSIRLQEFVVGDAVYVKSSAVNKQHEYKWYRADIRAIANRRYTVRYPNFKDFPDETVSREKLMALHHYNTKHYHGTAPTSTGKKKMEKPVP